MKRSLVRADKLHPSEQLSFDQLALVETLAIGCHASDRGNPRTGEHALIIGAGPIGLSVLEFNRLTGATNHHYGHVRRKGWSFAAKIMGLII